MGPRGQKYQRTWKLIFMKFSGLGLYKKVWSVKGWAKDIRYNAKIIKNENVKEHKS